jgi:protein-S-isoprenylcysteine O-methyltransferase Ste14
MSDWFQSQMSTFKQIVVSSRGYSYALFFLILIIHAWLFPPSGIFEEGTWTEAFTDSFGIGSLLTGAFLHIWAVSHAGICHRSTRLKTPKLIKTGPYAYIRHPVYASHFLIGLGMIFLSDAFILIPLFVTLFALQCHIIVSAEESVLKEQFGQQFDFYCLSVLKYIPTVVPSLKDFSLGSQLSVAELSSMWGVMSVGYFFEWLESPLHRNWLRGTYHMLIG